jgi:hypothetical protein
MIGIKPSEMQYLEGQAHKWKDNITTRKLFRYDLEQKI